MIFIKQLSTKYYLKHAITLFELGWLSSHLKDLPGNVGLFDIRASVKWVKEYITYFNGDPDRIVLSGQGSGASAATLLTMSEFTKGIIFNLKHYSTV